MYEQSLYNQNHGIHYTNCKVVHPFQYLKEPLLKYFVYHGLNWPDQYYANNYCDNSPYHKLEPKPYSNFLILRLTKLPRGAPAHSDHPQFPKNP